MYKQAWRHNNNSTHAQYPLARDFLTVITFMVTVSPCVLIKIYFLKNYFVSAVS